MAAGVKYCGFLEGGPLCRWPKHPAPDNEELIADLLAKKQKRPERLTVLVWEEKLSVVKKKATADKPSACFQCLKEYSDIYGVKYYFKSSHLQDCKCNFYDLSLQHEMHLCLHAEEVHRLCT